MEKPKYKAQKIGEIAYHYGYDKRTFWDCFTEENMHDMLSLGWKPHRYLLNVAVVQYVHEVVVARKPRKTVFDSLKDW